MGGRVVILEAHKWSRLMFRHIQLQTETLLFNTATRWSTARNLQHHQCKSSRHNKHTARAFVITSILYQFTKPQCIAIDISSLVRSASKAPWCSRLVPVISLKQANGDCDNRFFNISFPPAGKLSSVPTFTLTRQMNSGWRQLITSADSDLAKPTRTLHRLNSYELARSLAYLIQQMFLIITQ